MLNNVPIHCIKSLIFLCLTVTAASSDLGQVGQPYVRLLMKLVTGENSLEDFVVELNLQQFYSLLHQLEATHNKLQQNNTI
jgi:hypothetical protein